MIHMAAFFGDASGELLVKRASCPLVTEPVCSVFFR
jgi:hypothetical protein